MVNDGLGVTALATLLLVVAPAARQEISSRIEGLATVTDGDTIKIGKNRIRLFGVDAPEMDTEAGQNATAFMLGLAQDTWAR